jgi:putative sporulation protein YtaF
MLILFGLYLLVNSLKKGFNSGSNTGKAENKTTFDCYESTLRNPEIIDTNNSKTIDFKEAIIMGIFLCINNVGLGIGSSIAGFNIYLTSVLSLLFSLAFVPLGHFIGKRIFSDKLSAYSEVISAGIVIILGIYEMFI